MSKAFPSNSHVYLSELVNSFKFIKNKNSRSYLYLVHTVTEPAVFWQMFDPPLLFNLFHLTAHILPTLNWLYFPEHTIFQHQILTHIVSST